MSIKNWLTKDIIKSYEGKNIIITGGCGYIATSLINILKDINCNIIRVGRPEDKFIPLSGTATIEDFVGDVRMISTWEKIIENSDLVFHFAAQTSAYIANNDPKADLENNVLPVLNLLETCRKKSLKPGIIFSSTVTVIGVTDRVPVSEDFPENPVTIYDIHKLMAEKYLKQYANLDLVNCAILRLANVYGPGPKSSQSDRGILNQMIWKALKGNPLTVYKPGDRLRDYIYIDDVARAFLKAGCKLKKINGMHFIIGSGIGFSLNNAMQLVADRVLRNTGMQVEVMQITPPIPQSRIEDRNFVADSSLFKKMTGWKTHYQLSEGIDKTIEEYI